MMRCGFIRWGLRGFILLGLSVGLSAQQLSFSARVDRNQIAASDQLVYEVIISGEDLSDVPSPQLPDLRGKFNVLSSSESTAFSWINGKVSSSRTKRFVMVPVGAGELEIGASTIQFNGQTYRTSPIAVKVAPVSSKPLPSAGGQRPQQEASDASASSISTSAPVFLDATVSKTQLYVGEPLVYRLRFYYRVPLMDNPNLSLPKFDGFWTEALSVQNRSEMATVGGQRYQVLDVSQQVLFPVEGGNKTIQPAQAVYVVNPFEGARRAQTKPIAVKVLPLPDANRPDEFSGVVGDYKLEILDMPQQAIQNAPLTLHLRLSGKGNLKAINDLMFDETPQFKVYKSKVDDTVSYDQNVSGKRDFEYVIIPRSPGTQMLPRFRLVYFSPTKKAYFKTEVPEVQVSVQAGDVSQATESSTGESDAAVAQELRYLHPVDGSGRSVWQSGLAYGLILLNGLIWLGMALRLVWRRFFATDQKQLRARKALQTALNALTKVSAQESNYASVIQGIVLGYLSDKTGVGVQGLTQDQLVDVLRRVPLSSDKIKMVISLLDTLAMVIYAPSQAHETAGELIGKTQSILTDLDGDLEAK